MNEDDLLKELPDHIKKYLKLIPQRKKIGRNEKCPCGSGKRFKFCCLRKIWAEIDAKFFERVKNQIINKFD